MVTASAQATLTIIDDTRYAFSQGDVAFNDPQSPLTDNYDDFQPASNGSPASADGTISVMDPVTGNSAWAMAFAGQDSTVTVTQFSGSGSAGNEITYADTADFSASSLSQSLFSVSFDLTTNHDFILSGDLNAFGGGDPEQNLRSDVFLGECDNPGCTFITGIESFSTDLGDNMFNVSGTLLGGARYAMVAEALQDIQIPAGPNGLSGSTDWNFTLQLTDTGVVPGPGPGTIPEPSAMVLLGGGLLGLLGLSRRRRTVQ